MAVEVDIVPSLDRFEAILARMEGIGKEEAAKLVKAVDKELAGIVRVTQKHTTAAAKAAEKASNSTEKAAKKAAEAVMKANLEAYGKAQEGFERTSIFLKEVTSQLAPSLAPIADVAEGLGSNFLDLASKLGPVGAAAGVAAVGVAGLAAAAVGGAVAAKALSDAALEARDRLVEMGQADAISEHDLTQLTAYEVGLNSLRASTDLATVSLGSDLAGALGKVSGLMASAVSEVRTNEDAWHSFSRAVAVTSGVDLEVAAQLIRGTNVALDELTGGAYSSAAAMRTATAAAAELSNEINVFVGPVKTWSDEVPKATKATKSWEQSLLALVDAQSLVGKDTLANIPTAQDIAREIDYSDLMTSIPIQVEVIGLPAAQQQLANLSDAVSTPTVGGMEAPAAGDMDAFAISAEKAGAAIADAQAITGPWGDAISGISELMGQSASDAKSRLDDIVKANQKANKALQKADNSTDRARLEALIDFGKASKDAAKAEFESKKAQALKAFQAEKAGKLLSIGMSTAAAIMQAYAQMGPIAGTAAGVGITIAGAAQAAIVAKTKPPTFHTGGFPGGMGPAADEMDVRVKRGESVNSQRDYNRLQETMDRIDRHLATASGVEANVTVQIDGKHIPGKSTVKTGRRHPYSRSR